MRVDGYLFTPGHCSDEELRRECQAALRAGVPGVELVPGSPLPSFDTGPALRFPRQGQFHPLKYLAGLARVIRNSGGRIYTGTQVERISSGSPFRIAARNGPVVTAGAVVIATNVPVHDNLLVHIKQSPYRTYVISSRVPPGSVPQALYWDTPDPYHYVRSYEDYLIVGGEDHRSGEEDDGEERFIELADWARERFPIGGIEYQWSGQVMEPADGMGLIGQNNRPMFQI